MTAAALNPHELCTGTSAEGRREKPEQLLLLFIFFGFFFFSLFTLNRSCNSQLKEACQGKAKTNGVHCFDLLFSLEDSHGPILPDFFFIYICFCLYKQEPLFAQYKQLSFKKFMVPLLLPAALKKRNKPC